MESNFHTEDFTEEHYRNILLFCKKKFSFINYSDLPDKQQGLLWRHDVDISVHRALRLAEIEAEVGVRSTFFIHLHSEYYSVMEKQTYELIHKITSYGHSLGLHFDPGFYGDKIKDKTTLIQFIRKEKELMEDLFGVTIGVFSYHNPDIGDFLKYNEFTYAEIKNTYSTYFKEKAKYCSDSNGYWRFKRLSDFLKECTPNDLIQILTHPDWWTPEAMLPRDRVVRAVMGRANRLIKAYDSYFQNNAGRKNIGS